MYQPAEDSYLMSRILKEKLPNFLKENPNLKFLEIGTGTGIHLETASKLGVKKQNIFSSDIDIESVKHCNSLGFNCVHSDLFEKIKDLRLPSRYKKKSPFSASREEREENKGCPRFDLIIFNPPYLPEDTREPHDSKTATTGGQKGSEIITKFLIQAKNHLNENGKIFLITSSLTPNINFERLGYNAQEIGCEKLFWERLCVWEVCTRQRLVILI